MNTRAGKYQINQKKQAEKALTKLADQLHSLEQKLSTVNDNFKKKF